jgi:hypothetical protein
MATESGFITGMQAHHILGGQCGYLYNELDFSATNVDSGTVVQALKVNAGMVITDLRVQVVTAEGSNASCDIGDSTDPNGYDDLVNLDATAGTFTATAKGTDAYAVGKRYTADDTIDLEVHGDLTVGKIKIWAMYVRMK